MRRITLAFLSTIALLVLLFSYRTSLGGGVAAQPAQQAHVVSGSGGSTTTGQGPDPTSGGQITAPAGQSGSAASGGSSGGASANAAPSTSSAAPTARSSTSAAAAAAPTVVDGSTEMTQYGPVQVRVTIANGHITDVTAIQYPTAERRDLEINSYALPQLRSEVLSAQSAQVDAVSGATFTTEGYLASLQSALDVAHFRA